MREGRVIFNWDGCMAYLTRNPLSGEPFVEFPISQEQFLGYVVAPFAGKSIDSIFYCMGSGNVFTTRMETAERFGQHLEGEPDTWSQYARTIVPQCRRFWSEGTDDLEMVVGAAHRAALEVWASFRMNDGHFVWDDSPDSVEWCRFNREHPEFNLAGPKTVFDYARQEVRDWRFRHVEEICRKWDVDGVELDFFRFPSFFKEPASEKTPLMTELVGRVRRMLDEVSQERGHPLLLAVRTPENQEMSLGIGLDVNEWIDRDWLNVLIAGGGYMVMDLPIEGFVRATRGTRCQVCACINHHKPDPVTRAWAANAYAKGVDGLYLFNWCEQQAFDHINDPVWHELGDPGQLAGKSTLFCSDNRNDGPMQWGGPLCWEPSVPLPIEVSEIPSEFPILVNHDIPSGMTPVVSLRLTLRGSVGAGSLLVRLNGRELEAGHIPLTADRRLLARFELVVPEGGQLPCNRTHKPTHQFPVPVESLARGKNRIQIGLRRAASPAPAALVSAGILVDYSMPD